MYKAEQKLHYITLTLYKWLEFTHNRNHKNADISTSSLSNCKLYLYVNSILASSSYSIIKPYQKVHNFAARITLKIPRGDSVHQGLKTLHWLPVQFRTIFKLLCLVCNGLKGSGPIYLQSKLKVKTHKRSTRLFYRSIHHPTNTF